MGEGSSVSYKPKKHYLSLEQRLQSYSQVLQLRRQGLSYGQITERIHRSIGVRLYKSNISYWVHGRHAPLGRVNKFDGKPSPELPGVIGALFSDGTRYLDGSHHGIWLGAKDKDYAEAFGREIAKVLGKKRPYRPRWRHRRWIVDACSILLFKELDKPWQELRPFIEAYPANFLRMFFDGEGSIRGKALRVCNTNKELLLYIQQLLRQHFGIETTGPHPYGRKPGQCLRDRNGKIYKTKKQCYYLYVRARSLQRFRRYIGFTIKRKQRTLVKAIQK